MNKFIKTLIISISALGLGACAPGPTGGFRKQDIGTVAGGVAGGILGASVVHGRGRPFGAVTGAIIGSLLGSAVGKSMDDQDSVNAQQALIHTPVGQEAVWTSRRGVSYTVRPIHTYEQGELHCRNAWIITHDMQGRRHKTRTTICRRPGGRWHLVS